MDLITAAIVATLSTIANGGLAEIGSNILDDAYDAFKSLLSKKFGAKSSVMQAIIQLELNPESVSSRERLQKVIITTRAVEDSEIRLKAERLLSLARRIWTLPPRNLLFTGQEELLSKIHTRYQDGILLQGLKGLGGVGKTQIVIEYAHRHSQDYQIVLQAVAETYDTLVNGYVEIAHLLGLAQKNNKKEVVKAVKDWFASEKGWFLLIDNVQDAVTEKQIYGEFLPSKFNGLVLLTTCLVTMNHNTQWINVKEMEQDVGATLLLRRAGLIDENASLEVASPDCQEQAKKISETLGGLPLALDQAGAYLSENGCRLSDYQELYQTEKRKLLLKRRGKSCLYYPKSVAATLSLSIRKINTWSPFFWRIKKENRAAIQILRLCAYLAPDRIPEEIFAKGVENMRPTLKFMAHNLYDLNEAFGRLLDYSLIRRDSTNKTFSVHRLVQTVLEDEATPKQQKKRVECLVTLILNVFPSGEMETWPRCERLILHIQRLASFIKCSGIATKDAANLLHQAGAYLCKRAQYAEAKPLFENARSIREHLLEKTHQEKEYLDVATSLIALAMLHHELGHYEGDVLKMAKRALSIREQVLGKEHPEVANSLDCLSLLYKAVGHYKEALPLCERALSIREKLDKEGLEVATSMNNLAMLYKTLGRYDQARPLLEHVYQIKKEKLHPDNPSLATSMNNLAMCYYDLGRYDNEVLQLCERALSIRRDQLAHEHLMVRSLGNLAELYRARGFYKEAGSFSEKAFSICEQKLTDEQPDKAHGMNTLVMLFYDLGRYQEALSLSQEALGICKKAIKSDHPDVAVSMNNLAMLYQAVGNHKEALSLSQEALSFKEKVLASYPCHPSIARSMNNLAMLHQASGNYKKAVPLCEEAHIILELVFGEKHPDVATSMNNLAMLYHDLGRHQEALPLYERVLCIRKEVLGEEHPDVATSMNNLAMLYHDLGRHQEALPLFQHATSICEQSLGSEHPHTKTFQQNYACFQQETQ
jgi:tetratricopeptide (TPR) repeat protein